MGKKRRRSIETPARVRFAPSPTGNLHVGGARTALFNWLIARNTGGSYVLRVEDTDRERSTSESEAQILRALEWLGLDWDEGPLRQSERGEIYASAIERLRQSGAVYPAYETEEELEAMREEARRDKRAPVVRGRRDYSEQELAQLATEGRDPVWRFAVPLPGEVRIDDYIRGEVRFDHESIEDFVVARSDGSPTYNLAAAVDDMEMGITHVLRGEDHLSNTPKQVLVIQALGGTAPEYVHMPLIAGPDKKRLSKRHGAASTEELRDDGFIPKTVINSLALLGWSYDDKTTMFTPDELIEKFDVARISKSPAVFDIQKLKKMNGRYLRLMKDDEFTETLLEYLELSGYLQQKGEGAEEIVCAVAPAIKRKISTLAEYDELAGWLHGPLEMDPEAWEVIEQDLKHSIQVIGAGMGRLERTDPFDVEHIREDLSDELHILGEAARDFLEPQRIAITGRTISTGIYESLAILGKDEALRRYRLTMGRLAELWADA
ncbi:MAG: glutamate--tRNA ligase [Thermoleophilia bacterium]|nr:glutamate--tRNA ligase [Thermoleophilia bacterium]